MARGPRRSSQVFADVVLMTTAILMLSRVRPGDPPSLSLLAGGITTIAVADIAMVFQTGVGSYHVGDLADLGRVAGLGMMALAALCSVNESPTAASRNEILSRTLLWLPYLPLLLAAAVGLGHAVGLMAHGPMLAALGILVAAVLARQFIVLVENQSLLSEVAREAFRDSLTGLANRAQFLHRLEQAAAHATSRTPQRSRCCASTSTTSSRSTTPWAIRPATNFLSGSPGGSPLRWETRAPLHGLVVTNSPCSSKVPSRNHKRRRVGSSKHSAQQS